MASKNAINTELLGSSVNAYNLTVGIPSKYIFSWTSDKRNVPRLTILVSLVKYRLNLTTTEKGGTNQYLTNT